MAIPCPRCHEFLPAGAVDLKALEACCPACGHAFPVERILPAGIAGEAVLHPPPGAWFHATPEEVRFGATTRSWMAWMAVPFVVLYAGGAFGNIYLPQLLAWEFDPVRSALGIPFVVSTIIFTLFALMTLYGKIEITIREGMATLFVGLGRWGWRRRFPWGSVENIHEEKPDPKFYPHNICADEIVIEAKRRLAFGWLLEKERLDYLLKVLVFLRHIS